MFRWLVATYLFVVTGFEVCGRFRGLSDSQLSIKPTGGLGKYLSLMGMHTLHLQHEGSKLKFCDTNSNNIPYVCYMTWAPASFISFFGCITFHCCTEYQHFSAVVAQPSGPLSKPRVVGITYPLNCWTHTMFFLQLHRSASAVTLIRILEGECTHPHESSPLPLLNWEGPCRRAAFWEGSEHCFNVKKFRKTTLVLTVYFF